MEIDPQVAGLVAAINTAAAEAPPLAEQTVAERREAYAALSAIPGPGPDLDRVADLTIAGVPCRRYSHGEPRGILVYFHGGGWVIGDLDTHDQVCRQLAVESAATVISVDYRLAPEHAFPAAVDDCWAVTQAIAAGRADYGSSAEDRIVVGGDSAGGNLAAVVALMARDHGVDLAAQMLIYPSVEMDDDSPSMTENATGYVLTVESMDWFGSHYQPDPADWRASPARAETLTGVAPAVVLTAGFDPLRDQGVAYAKALEAAGVEVTHTNYDNQVHVFFQLGPILDAGAAAVSQIAAATAQALG